MLTVAVVVEGEYDAVVFRELLPKCRAGVKVIARQCSGPVTGKCSGIVLELERRKLAKGIFVICDADGEPPKERVAAISKRLPAKDGKIHIQPIVIVQKMEALLLADEQALKTIGVIAKFPRPEKILDPKHKLRSVLSRINRLYTQEVAREIAVAARVEVIAERCPSFEPLRSAILAL